MVVFLFCSCTPKKKGVHIVIENTLDLKREFETLSLSKINLGVNNGENIENYTIQDPLKKEALTVQYVDSDEDGVSDVILFQPVVKPLSKKNYVLIKKSLPIQDTVHCYSRFVPERTDDYAWENNKVAFRTYGPKAQEMIEENIPGGTLSSGIDAWLKRVEYPIINRWYKKYAEGTGTYHEDTGEGLDNFHVGISRGVGGTAIKIDSTYFFSKNFTSWRTITTGPIRTSFVLTYNWDAGGRTIFEEKKISLDYGSNLSKYEVTINGSNTLSTGLTLHNKNGRTQVNLDEGWISYWESIEDSELGTGIIVPINYFKTYEKYISKIPDVSNLYAFLNVIEGRTIFYSGFGWKKNKEFNTARQWKDYLSLSAMKINNPLEVTIEVK